MIRVNYFGTSGTWLALMTTRKEPNEGRAWYWVRGWRAQNSYQLSVLSPAVAVGAVAHVLGAAGRRWSRQWGPCLLTPGYKVQSACLESGALWGLHRLPPWFLPPGASSFPPPHPTGTGTPFRSQTFKAIFFRLPPNHRDSRTETSVTTQEGIHAL